MKRLNTTTLIILHRLLVIAGIIGLCLGSYLVFSKPSRPNIKGVNPSPPPSSIKPTAKAISSYTVAPTLPKYISIPSINLAQARVLQLGLLPSGAIATPNDIYDTGWYDGSAKPGQPGAMFIYGHVASWTANGVFNNLKKLKPGDDIVVTRGDNKQFKYQVVSTKIYPYNNVDMNKVLSPIDSERPGLNLMTCTGPLIKNTSEFSKRLVVFGKLL